ncbi:MAG: response regulator, partial [Oscillospiraceae bacterium]|nr:response regulator [Oscillospiraceae bacterium]
MLNWAVVVDDDLLNLKAAERILSVHGYRVTRLHSGEELLEFVKENTPDIILLDLHMSGIDGFETIRRLRGSECSQNIPVIVLTADRDEDNEVRALSAGAMDFVGKPFTPSVLLMRVRNTIDLMHLQTDLKEEVTRITERMRREHDRNERLSLQIVQTLAGTIDAKDSYTRGHSSRVAEYAQKIAARAGYSPRMQEKMYMMGLLHDVGKIGVPDTVINKPSRLTAEEYELIKMHPSVGFEILKNITEMPKLAIGARWHHERYDGTGYPDGIAGTEIPEEARIIAIADAYDAMSSRRSYHEVLPQKYIISEL